MNDMIGYFGWKARIIFSKTCLEWDKSKYLPVILYHSVSQQGNEINKIKTL